ncbi:hypothetical protein Aave_1060 [Paracidovorax citrulli AAC00-1]|uniref:FAD/NAD(P)-binding domain-containing protein n=3 Tax=Paracidovorax citrulli TaxID=80869 RepID=A1TL19_PARC0|nr:hypothetical protein Aave_1060 [Paracidovorax citrulli AAC00-1]
MMHSSACARSGRQPPSSPAQPAAVHETSTTDRPLSLAGRPGAPGFSSAEALAGGIRARARSTPAPAEQAIRPRSHAMASTRGHAAGLPPEPAADPSTVKTRGGPDSALNGFLSGMKEGDKALFVVGGGTAALTYLSTVDLDSRFTHVVVVGDQGYWNRVGHRLAQPHHILALPHEDSAGFVDPGRHDALRRILPHDDRSAYVHSRDYQARLARLGQYTRGLLESQGRKVLFAGGVSVGKITKSDGAGYRIATNAAGPAVVGHKVVIATGAAPARSLANHLLPDKSTRDLPHILGYDDILAPGAAERIQGKSVMVYGGGPTAAWAMEVAKGHAGSSMWVARNGFGVAEAAGPRVGAIIEGSRDCQIRGEIEAIRPLGSGEAGGEPRLRVVVASETSGKAVERKSVDVDYLVNSIGQDAYAPGGLHDVLSADIKAELQPIPDRNRVSGVPGTMLGFGTETGDLQIIGAAAASYQDASRGLKPGRLASETLPRSGKIGITIGGVVASVAALTDYMPMRQNPATGEMKVTGLNLHVMNATQLAVYLTGAYPDAPAERINTTVEQYLAARSCTEFGLPDVELQAFMEARLGPLPRIEGIAAEPGARSSAA